jgi:hypothetical protein
MRSRGVVCTIIAKNYFAHARCLLDSIAQFHPDLARFVILVDRPDGYFDPQRENFTILCSDSLAIPDSKWFHFKYTLIELSTAVKPYVLEYLFQKLNFDFVIFLDPDILVCSELVEVVDALASHSLVLTPHLTAPMQDDRRPCELDILRSGVYNLGFFAMARTEEALAFLEWWKARLYEHCVVDLPRGLFLDQRWADFAPCFVSRVCVLRDPTHNVAHWNLHERRLSLHDGTFLVDGSPLRFFHFSGFDPARPHQLSKHQNRYRIADWPALEVLVQQYSQLMHRYGYSEVRQWPYAYAVFDNGTRIPDFGRPLHFDDPGITKRIEDPFSDEGYAACLEIWNEPLQRIAGRRSKMGTLAYRLYRANTDLQTTMPNVFDGDYRAFVKWLRSLSASDYDLPDEFLSGCKGKLETANTCEETVQPGAAPSATPRMALTRLALQIYDKRPDLQAFFPDPSGEDAAKYLVWLLSYGRRQYALSEVFLSTLRRQWNAEVDRLPGIGARVRHRTLLAASLVTSAIMPALGRTLRIPSSMLARRPKQRVEDAR